VSASWSLAERGAALERAGRDGVDVLVVGGGITGAGVLRDAASRGLGALAVERADFAAGTSSRSSKLVHGGLRYIGEGQLGLTREACRERDLLLRLNPNLVRPLPFLFPAYRGSKLPLWQVRSALWVYKALASFRATSRFRMLRPAEVAAYSRDLRSEGLRGAGLYFDAQVDDARLVLETLRSARALGAEAVNHAELVGFLKDERGRIVGAHVRDHLAGAVHAVAARAVVNAAGAGLDRVRSLDRPVRTPELRPAKGVHVAFPRDRLHAEGAVIFEAADRRHLFLIPWDEVWILGTTDAFSTEIDEPSVGIDEVHYLLSAANEAFPRVALTTNDLRSVYAGVRPLVASGDEATPSSSVSREHRIYADPSGLLSVAGGKLTTYRAIGESLVDRVLESHPELRRPGLSHSRTAKLPLREDRFERAELEAHLCARYGLAPARASRLVSTYGEAADWLLADAPPGLRRPIGSAHALFAEIPWSFRTECPASLCDLLEQRLRLPIFAVGQGLPELDRVAAVAAEAAGWDAARTREEARLYADAVRRRYQICARTGEGRRASAA
jgi:glycerol-3-phosphate dehydrogenase